MEDKLLNKLRKLINLRDGAIECGSEGEAQAAACLITKLLYEHNLKESEIPEEINTNPVILQSINYKTDICSGKWYCDLVVVLCKYNMCKPLIKLGIKNNRRFKDKFDIIGKKTNIDTVLYLLSFLSNKFYSIGIENYKKVENVKRAEYLKSFLRGCVQGLHEKYRLLDVSDCKSIVVTNESLINNFIADYYGNVKFKTTSKSKEGLNKSAFNSGFDTGKNIAINEGIENSNKKLLQ